MQILILTLTLCLGLAYASGGGDHICPQIDGAKQTYFIATSNRTKTEVGGPLRAYVRSLECTNNGQEVTINFYSKSVTPGVCEHLTLIGTRGPNDVFQTDFEGANNFEFLYVKHNCIVVYIENTDAHSTTHLVELFATCDDAMRKCYHHYEHAVRDKGIPMKNSQYVLEDDSCPK